MLTFRRSALVIALGVLAAQPAAALETKSYVLSWFAPAMYSHDGDCEALDPIADPGRAPIESLYRRFLADAGKTPEEVETLMKDAGTGKGLSLIYDIAINR